MSLAALYYVINAVVGLTNAQGCSVLILSSERDSECEVEPSAVEGALNVFYA